MVINMGGGSFCESLCCSFILRIFKNGEKGFSSPGTCSSCGNHLLWSLCPPTFLVYLSLKGNNCFIRNLTKPGSIPSHKLLLATAVCSCPRENMAPTLLDTVSYPSHFQNVQIFMLSSWLGPSNLAIPSTVATVSSLKIEAFISDANLSWMRIHTFKYVLILST